MRFSDLKHTPEITDTVKSEPVIQEARINLRKLGEPVNSRMEAIRRFSDGDKLFAFHEMGEAPWEITDLDQLDNYTPDQLLAVSRHAISAQKKTKQVAEFVNVDAIHAEALREYLLSNPELLKNRQDFFVECLKSDQEVIDYVRSALIPEMRKYQVPVTPENHFARLSSAVFEGISASLASGKQLLEKFKSLDQRRNLKISVGTRVSVLNLRISQDFVELFGFRTPKKITRIYREPTENKIVQLEFNNDPEDVWPRKALASYNGELVMTSAFFPSARDLDQAVSVIQLSTPSEFTIRTNIMESHQEKNKKQGMAEGSDHWKGLGFSARSDVLWPAKMFESANPAEAENFSSWLSDYRDGLDTPAPGKKCLLAMVNRLADEIVVYYGVARYAGENASHYQLEIASGTHNYSRNNQLVFASRQAFDHFKTLLSTKFGDTRIEFQKMPVMETRERVAESQLAELSKDTLKSYFPKRHASAKALARTDYDKAKRIADTDLPRALSKLKDPEYGKKGPAEVKLKENDYASELGPLQLSDQEIIENSRVVGTVGSRKISVFSSGGEKIYFFTNPEKSKIHALVYLSGSRLAGIKNFSENSGLVFNLLQYLINIAGQKLRVDPVDGLTPDGINWVIKQIKRPNGFQVQDQNGDPVDPRKLYKEWHQARVSNKPGPTRLIIGESKNSQKIKQNEQQLMPLDIWGATLVKLSEERSHVPDLFESPKNSKKTKI